MRENEIIKALGCCIRGNQCAYSCPYDEEEAGCNKCTSALAKDALDLINRQNAEIERLKSERNTLLKECKKCGRKTQRKISKLQKQNLELLDMCAEQGEKAIKEFAERLKNGMCFDRDYNDLITTEKYIKKVAKEMVGDDNG